MEGAPEPAISFFLCAITDVADQETVKCLVGIAFSFQHNLQIVLPRFNFPLKCKSV